jgi:hypothetical protein
MTPASWFNGRPAHLVMFLILVFMYGGWRGMRSRAGHRVRCRVHCTRGDSGLCPLRSTSARLECPSQGAPV